MESVLTASPPRLRATLTARSDFPAAVGPTIEITFTELSGFLVGRTAGGRGCWPLHQVLGSIQYRGTLMTFIQKITDLFGKHADKADPAIDKAGDMVDKKTGGKYQGQVDAAQQAAKDAAARAAQKPHSNS